VSAPCREAYSIACKFALAMVGWRQRVEGRELEASRVKLPFGHSEAAGSTSRASGGLRGPVFKLEHLSLLSTARAPSAEREPKVQASRLFGEGEDPRVKP